MRCLCYSGKQAGGQGHDSGAGVNGWGGEKGCRKISKERKERATQGHESTHLVYLHDRGIVPTCMAILPQRDAWLVDRIVQRWALLFASRQWPGLHWMHSIDETSYQLSEGAHLRARHPNGHESRTDVRLLDHYYSPRVCDLWSIDTRACAFGVAMGQQRLPRRRAAPAARHRLRGPFRILGALLFCGAPAAPNNAFGSSHGCLLSIEIDWIVLAGPG